MALEINESGQKLSIAAVMSNGSLVLFFCMSNTCFHKRHYKLGCNLCSPNDNGFYIGCNIFQGYSGQMGYKLSKISSFPKIY